MSKIYSAQEVAKHNTTKDLWIVYQDGVYDITKFLSEHPGGEEVMLNLGGQDATICFDDIGHSTEAIQLRESYKIGTVVGSLSGDTTSSPGTSSPGTSSGGVQNIIDDDTWEYEPPKHEQSPWLPVMIAVAVVVYASIFYHLWYS